jgi:hypothetical protein
MIVQFCKTVSLPLSNHHRSVGALIRNILPVSRPSEIVYAVVGWISVEVPDLVFLRRSRSMEGFADKSMHLP